MSGSERNSGLSKLPIASKELRQVMIPPTRARAIFIPERYFNPPQQNIIYFQFSYVPITQPSSAYGGTGDLYVGRMGVDPSQVDATSIPIRTAIHYHGTAQFASIREIAYTTKDLTRVYIECRKPDVTQPTDATITITTNTSQKNRYIIKLVGETQLIKDIGQIGESPEEETLQPIGTAEYNQVIERFNQGLKAANALVSLGFMWRHTTLDTK